MNFSPHDYVSIDDILSDVQLEIRDYALKDQPESFYISLVQRALSELAFETWFDERKDIFDMPEGGCLTMPKGMFNVRDVFIFNGNDCNVETRVNVYSNESYQRTPNGGANIKRNDGGQNEDFFHISPNTLPSSLYFYNIHNGVFQFSPNCENFERIMFVYRGAPGLGDYPLVPPQLREAVIDFVSEKAANVNAAYYYEIDPRKSQMLFGVAARKRQERLIPYDGSWAQARKRVRLLDENERKNYMEYISSFG